MYPDDRSSRWSAPRDGLTTTSAYCTNPCGGLVTVGTTVAEPFFTRPSTGDRGHYRVQVLVSNDNGSTWVIFTICDATGAPRLGKAAVAYHGGRWLVALIRSDALGPPLDEFASADGCTWTSKGNLALVQVTYGIHESPWTPAYVRPSCATLGCRTLD